jgi:SNF2 family DNA or RNA helicase
MGKDLLPHQIEDARFLASKKFAGCFSGMGSGKTLTALEAAKHAFTTAHTGPNAAIIVGPPISLFMWKEEFEQHLGKRAQLLATGKTVIDPNADAWIMSYEIATKRRDELKALGAKVLICDESHALKSTTAKRTQAIIGKHGLCESVGHTWLLTGTPVTRWNDDIFSFMCRAGAGQLAEKIGKVDLGRFRLRYCVVQKKKFSQRQRFATEVTVGNRNTDELNELLFDGGMAVRRELADVWAAMPPLTINHLQVQLEKTPELRELLKALEKKSMNEIREDIGKKEEHIATTRRLIALAKVKHAAIEIADRVEAGVSPILVGCWHIEVIDELHNLLTAKGVRAAKLDGRTPSQLKQTLQQDFNDGNLDVLVGQIAAMGVSLNLQGGSHIIEVETDWSPAVMDQFMARCHRIGQKDHVHVDVFEADTKLDQAVRRISAAKRSGQSTIMEQDDE